MHSFQPCWKINICTLRGLQHPGRSHLIAKTDPELQDSGNGNSFFWGKNNIKIETCCEWHCFGWHFRKTKTLWFGTSADEIQSPVKHSSTYLFCSWNFGIFGIFGFLRFLWFLWTLVLVALRWLLLEGRKQHPWLTWMLGCVGLHKLDMALHDWRPSIQLDLNGLPPAMWFLILKTYHI